MSEKEPANAATMSRAAQQHLQSLQAAGVEWLPLAPLEATTAAAALPVGPEQAARFAPAAAEVPALAARRQALTILAEQVARCTRCPALVASRTKTVFGDGLPGAELCFVGEAPGGDEDAQGLPFVGAAGQLLNRIIAGCGMKREEVYICNTLKCRPPGNRTPLVNEVENCRGYLERQLELVQPRFLCALGSSAAKALLNTTLSMARLRRRFHDYKGIPVLCTYHPAYLLPHRHPEMKREVWEDMKMLLARMGRPVPVQGARA
jgi:uracil-DNA glycosylase family 4